MSIIIPSFIEFFGPLTGPYNNIVGIDAAETISGTDGDDLIEGLDSQSTTQEYSVLDGGLGNDLIKAGAGLDILFGGDGDDLLIDGGDSGELYGGSGDDYMIASDGGYNLLVGGEGTDVLIGNAGEDYLFGGAGGDLISAGEQDDFIYGGDGNDQIEGGQGNDDIHGDAGDDVIFGGSGDDFITTFLGSDIVEGGSGDDTILSRSDSGEPITAQDEDYVPRDNLNDPIEASNDILNGGAGADTFVYQLELDAGVFVADRNQDGNTGVLDWEAIATENDNPHDHWVRGIGNDVIGDFNLAEGDSLIIRGFSVEVAVEGIDTTDDGINDSTRLTLYSDQGDNGGAHHEDFLGTITLEGATLTDSDITVENDVFYGAYETYDDLLG